MMEDSGFRDEDSVNEGLGVFRGNDADSPLHVGDNTKDTAVGSCFHGYINMLYVVREMF